MFVFREKKEEEEEWDEDEEKEDEDAGVQNTFIFMPLPRKYCFHPGLLVD